MIDNKIQIDKDKAVLLDQASVWISRLSSDCISNTDKQAFSLWLMQSDAHIQAYDEMSDLWQDLGVCSELPLSLTTNNAATDKLMFNPLYNLAEYLESWLPKAGFVAASVIAITLVFNTSLFEQTTIDTYQTGVGQQQLVELSDGSTIYLNTKTHVTINYIDDKRLIELQSGEAYFTVAKNKSRPFIVNIGNNTATALGTAFNIRRTGDNAEITVTEGIVKVASLSHPQRDNELLYVNDQVETTIGGVGNIEHVTLIPVTAWTQQRLVFEEKPLSEVIAEINRYTDRHIAIADSRLSAAKISGVFSLDDPDAIVEALRKTLNIKINYVNDSLIVLYKPRS